MSMPVKIAAQAPQTQRPTYVGGGKTMCVMTKSWYFWTAWRS